MSENCRVSTPTWQSMNQMMTPDELWEEGTYALTAHHPCEIPESWMKHTPNEGWLKLGPVEHYRDAETPWCTVSVLPMQSTFMNRSAVFGEGVRRGKIATSAIPTVTCCGA